MPEGDGSSGPLDADTLKKAGASDPQDNEEVEPALMRVRDAGRRLALSPSMVRKLISGGQLKAVRIGRSVRLRIDDVEALVQSRG